MRVSSEPLVYQSFVYKGSSGLCISKATICLVQKQEAILTIFVTMFCFVRSDMKYMNLKRNDFYIFK